jgi:putative ATP-dependent endonuclease of the OLD family
MLDPAHRRLKKSHFHVPHDEQPEQAPVERALWIEADFEFPELVGKAGDQQAPAVPGNFAHMQLIGVEGPAQMRFRLHGRLDQDDDIEESFTFVIKVDDDGHPLEEGRVAKHDRNAIQVHYLPARRDPADHISYSANALLGRALRSANWARNAKKSPT